MSQTKGSKANWFTFALCRINPRQEVQRSALELGVPGRPHVVAAFDGQRFAMRHQCGERLGVAPHIVLAADGREVFRGDFYTIDQVVEAVEEARSEP